jgi:hypothetical protein
MASTLILNSGFNLSNSTAKGHHQAFLPTWRQVNDDGSIVVIIPDNLPPDTKAYNLNNAKNQEKKTKMVARLRAKLAKKQ